MTTKNNNSHHRSQIQCYCLIFLILLPLHQLSHSAQQPSSQFDTQTQPELDRAKVKLTPAEIRWINQHPIVIVAGTTEWIPFDFVDDDGHYKGIANDYLNLIAKKTGLNFQLNIDKWGKNLQKIHNKKVDVLSAVFYTKVRSEYLLYSSPYFEALDYFFIRDDLNVDTLADLNGKRVAMVKHFAHVKLLKKHFPKIVIVQVNSFADSIDAVLENRADMLFDSYAALTHILKKRGINTIIPFKSTRGYGTNPIHFVSRNNQPELASIIQKGLDAITYPEKQAIYSRWIGSTPSSSKHFLQLTDEEKAWLAEHPVIRLGSEQNWLPFEYIDQAGQQQGLTADLLRYIEQRLGIHFNLVSPKNWSQTFAELNKHEIDIVGSIVKTKQREKHLNFTDTYISPAIVIYTRKDNQTIKHIDDLQGKTVSIESNYYVQDRLRTDYPNIDLNNVTSTSQALEALSHGKVDAYIGIQGPANSIIEQFALTNLKIVGKSGLGKANLRFALRNDWPIFQRILNKVLDSISDSEMLSLRRKWLGVSAIIDKQLLSPAELQWLKKHKTMRFAGDPNWLPYEAFDKKGNYVGIVADYLKLIKQKLDIDLQIIQTKSWAETISKVTNGEIDVVSETIDSKLNEQLKFTQVYLQSPIVIIMNDDENYVDNINQIKDKKIALIKNYGYVPNILIHYPAINFQDVDNIQEGLTKVSTGKIDALIATLAQASYHISEMGINNVRIVGKTEFNTQLAFGMTQEFAPLANLFNKALSDIRPSEKKKILDVWGSPKYVAKTDYSLLATIASGLILLNLLFYYWNRKLKIEVQKREASEQEVRLLNQRFSLATQLVSLGVWQWDLSTTNSFVFDDRIFEMYGLPKQDSVPYEDWIKTVHQEDHQIINESLNRLQESGGQQHLEFRTTAPDGSTRYIYAGATIIKDERDNSTKLYGVNLDITERKQAETQLKSIIEALPLAVVITNNDGEILLENPQAIKELGGNKSVIGRKASEFYENSKENNQVLKSLIKKRAIYRQHVKYRVATNQTLDCLLSVLPIKYENKDLWLVVIINLSDRIEIEKHLANAKEQAEKANKAKSEFLANMSHEIRTPMNAIIGFTEILSQQVKEQHLKAYVNSIHSAGNTLLTLINDILDLSKIEAGKLEIEKQATNPHELFTEMGNIFMISIHNKKLQLFLDIDPKMPKNLLLDGIRLRQVLFNLIGNAVKFTAEGHVRLKAKAINQDQINNKLDLLIEIEDTGIGIAHNQLQNIFAEFTQSENHNPQKYGGTGLGLSISQRLTELMGGNISVTSQPGKGSSFSIRLNNVDVTTLNAKTLPQHKQITSNSMLFSPATVMAVDDIASNRDLINATLLETSLTILQAENGQQAIELVKQHTIDLILMDIRMPIMDGYVAAEKIKSSQNIPIIALTASVMKDDHNQTKSKHFDGYLQKPVLRNDLFQTLGGFLEHQVIDQEIQQRSTLTLTENQQKVLPEVLDLLEQQTEQWRAIQKNNNITEMKKFTSQLLEIAETYQFTPIMEYANQLNEHINVFDVNKMKEQLNAFTSFHEELIAFSLMRQI